MNDREMIEDILKRNGYSISTFSRKINKASSYILQNIYKNKHLSEHLLDQLTEHTDIKLSEYNILKEHIKKPDIYILYNNKDEIVGEGTKEELAEQRDVSVKTITWYAAPASRKRNSYIAIKTS